MNEWFDSLDTRERQFVSIGAVVVVIALAYFLGWTPLDKKHNELKTDVARWESSLADLRPLRGIAANGGQIRANTTAGVQQSPIITVDQTLRSRGLDSYRKRSQPTSSNGIRVEFENVAFDELVLWLGDLSGQHAMHVQSGSFSVGARVSPGRINASLTLERAL
jgi:type II secretory pathway component PulM